MFLWYPEIISSNVSAYFVLDFFSIQTFVQLLNFTSDVRRCPFWD